MSIEPNIKKGVCILYIFVSYLFFTNNLFLLVLQKLPISWKFYKITSFTIIWEAVLYAIHLIYQPIKKKKEMNSSYKTEEYNPYKILSSIITTTAITTAIIPPKTLYSWIIAYELTLKIGFKITTELDLLWQPFYNIYSCQITVLYNTVSQLYFNQKTPTSLTFTIIPTNFIHILEC